MINDGTVISLANPNSMDGGIDSDMGTSLNGGKGDRPDMNDNSERPAPPEGMENSGRPNSFGGNMQSSSDTESYDFVLTSSSHGFTNVSGNILSTSNNGIGFTDVASNS